MAAKSYLFSLGCPKTDCMQGTARSVLLRRPSLFAFRCLARCGSLVITNRTMGKRSYKNFRPADFIPRSQKPTAIIPGLGVDVPELQQARALWQLNRFDD